MYKLIKADNKTNVVAGHSTYISQQSAYCHCMRVSGTYLSREDIINDNNNNNK